MAFLKKIFGKTEKKKVDESSNEVKQQVGIQTRGSVKRYICELRTESGQSPKVLVSVFGSSAGGITEAWGIVPSEDVLEKWRESGELKP